jgi:hypothetical protein
MGRNEGTQEGKGRDDFCPSTFQQLPPPRAVRPDKLHGLPSPHLKTNVLSFTVVVSCLYIVHRFRLLSISIGLVSKLWQWQIESVNH